MTGLSRCRCACVTATALRTIRTCTKKHLTAIARNYTRAPGGTNETALTADARRDPGIRGRVHPRPESRPVRTVPDRLRRRRGHHLRHAERDATRSRDVERTGAAVLRADCVLQDDAEPGHQPVPGRYRRSGAARSREG